MSTAVRRVAVLGATALLATMALWQGVDEPTQAHHATGTPRSTLEEYPGFRFVESELDEESFDQEERARQHMIAECMADQGWSYEPAYTTRVESWEEFAPQAELAVEGPEVPTEAKERERYHLDLYGVPDPNSPTQGLGGGCSAAAFERIPGVYSLYSDLMPEVEAMRMAIREDRDWKAADAAWIECMAVAGHAVTSPEAMLASVDDGATSQVVLAADRTLCQEEIMAARHEVRIEHEDEFARRHREALEAHARRLELDQALLARYAEAP